jgi:hypothetical protein
MLTSHLRCLNSMVKIGRIQSEEPRGLRSRDRVAAIVIGQGLGDHHMDVLPKDPRTQGPKDANVNGNSHYQ